MHVQSCSFANLKLSYAPYKQKIFTANLNEQTLLNTLFIIIYNLYFYIIDVYVDDIRRTYRGILSLRI